MVDQGRELCKNPMQKWLDDNRILMQLTINEGKSVVAERVLKHLWVKSIKQWQQMIVNLIFVIWVN